MAGPNGRANRGGGSRARTFWPGSGTTISPREIRVDGAGDGPGRPLLALGEGRRGDGRDRCSRGRDGAWPLTGRGERGRARPAQRDGRGGRRGAFAGGRRSDGDP